jgi:hypothetical protein
LVPDHKYVHHTPEIMITLFVKLPLIISMRMIVKVLMCTTIVLMLVSAAIPIIVSGTLQMT